MPVNFSLAEVTGGNRGGALSGAGEPGVNDFANQFLRSFLGALELRKQNEAIEAQREEREYLKDFHKHSLASLKFEERTKEFDTKRNAAKMFENYPLPPGQEQPEFDFSNFPDLGIPPVKYRPSTYQEGQSRLAGERKNELGFLTDKQNLTESANVTPEEVDAIPGFPLPAGRHSKTMLEPILKHMLEQVNIPAGVPSTVPPGRYDKEALGPMGAGTTMANTNTQNDLNRRNARDVAGIYASARGNSGGGGWDIDSLSGEPEVVGWANKVASGEATLTNVPTKGDMRNKVITLMDGAGVGIQDKDYRGKKDQFTAAKSALDTIETHLAEYANAAWTSPKDKAVAAMQLNADIDAFTRMVGRASGEKGVFTDQDKADFKKLISPGLLVSSVAPGVAKSRLDEARKYMDNIGLKYQESYKERIKPTFSRGAAPAPGTPRPASPATRGATPGAAPGGQPIVQRNTEDGSYRYSLDGGRTWFPGQPPGGPR